MYMSYDSALFILFTFISIENFLHDSSVLRQAWAIWTWTEINILDFKKKQPHLISKIFISVITIDQFHRIIVSERTFWLIPIQCRKRKNNKKKSHPSVKNWHKQNNSIYQATGLMNASHVNIVINWANWKMFTNSWKIQKDIFSWLHKYFLMCIKCYLLTIEKKNCISKISL